jgi:hypothetical protein
MQQYFYPQSRQKSLNRSAAGSVYRSCTECSSNIHQPPQNGHKRRLSVGNPRRPDTCRHVRGISPSRARDADNRQNRRQPSEPSVSPGHGTLPSPLDVAGQRTPVRGPPSTARNPCERAPERSSFSSPGARRASRTTAATIQIARRLSPCSAADRRRRSTPRSTPRSRAAVRL